MALNIDLTKLTDEQQQILKNYLYDKSKYTEDVDKTSFVIPFIAMNDGHSPAQIRTQPKGLYKDIQRSPFLRKSGTFSEDGTIPDIDISPLVYYGTLEQSKIAPTLENVDIKLYYREPNLKKVTNGADKYADSYIWRELPVGFHTYNNDTVYGYEWLVLQDDYVNTDGVYNLHMNVEDGLGCCKFAGTQAPISLANTQYKIIVTAKNLWNREYSLIDTTPVLHSLEGSSDELAPTVDAVKKYYSAALKTLQVVTDALYVGDSEDPIVSITKDNVVLKQLRLGEIENLENYTKAISTDFDTHKSATIDGATFNEQGAVIGIHGIVNKGIKGNIAAKTLDGLSISNGSHSIVDDVTDRSAYIPFVNSNNEIDIGTAINFYSNTADSNNTPIYKISASKLDNTLVVSNSVKANVDNLLTSVSVGFTVINARVSTVNGSANLALTAGSTEEGNVNLDTNKITVNSVAFKDSTETINSTRVAYWNGQSSIAYKNPISELIGIKLKDFDNGKFSTLTPNTNTDADGNPVAELDTNNLDSTSLQVASKDAETFDKLGSALQALHELPLGTYKYKRGQEEYKEQLGIFVERVNQIRDHLLELAGNGENDSVPTDDNYLVYKKNTLLKSSNDKVVDSTEGSGNSSTVYQNRLNNNAYTYTQEEIKSIAHYLDLTTSKKELAQEIRNTVGILLKAAKETQDRLLDVETAVYGFDAKTIPGSDEAKTNFINEHIDSKLQEQLNNNPLLLGLNRLMRVISLEIFDTTDLETIDAEIKSVYADSDKLGEKITIKSRMDKVDEIVSESFNQIAAIVKYYYENVVNDESKHTYTDIVDVNNTEKVGSIDTSESETLLDNLADDHLETKDRDKGRTWQNLPAKEDVSTEEKAKVGFGQVASSAHKHTPKKEESGVIRIPEVKTESHTDADDKGNTKDRNWLFFDVDKDAATNTYYPKFKAKAVAWDSAKLERINLKLSEVTKTIYGTDDVTASLPNRTEVLRRNITNLVDDLYPNRSFKIERPFVSKNDISAEIFLPFKTSKIQRPDNTVASDVTDEEIPVQHTSVIKYFNDALFNFNIQNNYFGEESDLKAEAVANYKNNKQITLDAKNSTIRFDTSKLVSDTVSFDSTNYGTYSQAYSRVDLLESLVGVKDCYIPNLCSTTILDAFKIGKKYSNNNHHENVSPKSKGWYESVDDSNYQLTQDTTVVDDKDYFVKVNTDYVKLDLSLYLKPGYILDLAASGKGDIDDTMANTLTDIKKYETLIAAMEKNLIAEQDTKTSLEGYKAKLTEYKNEEQEDKGLLELAIVSIDNAIDLHTKYIDEITERLNSVKNLLSIAQTESAQLLVSADLYLDVYGGEPLLKDYTKELSFTNLLQDEDVALKDSPNYKDTTATNLILASNIGFVLSRKIKPMQARITTLEAFADELAKGFSYINIQKNKSQFPDTIRAKYSNKRFEAMDVYEALKDVGNYIYNLKANAHPMIFDLDLAESYNGTFNHNLALWQIIAFSTNVTKGNLAVAANSTSNFYSSYTITGTLNVDRENLPLPTTSTNLSDYVKDTQFTITVQYIKSGSTLNELDSSTIYLTGKQPTTSLSKFYSNDNNDVLNGSAGYQNQTEYNIYKTMENLFGSLLNKGSNTPDPSNILYRQLMKLTYPVGSVYINTGTNPATLFGGNWEEITATGLPDCKAWKRLTLED